MEIKICQNRDKWEKCQKEHNLSEFLQSWDWGEFQSDFGRKAVRVEFGQNFIQGFEHRLPGLGKYLYLPRVQMPDGKLPQELLEYFLQQGYLFLRLEPVNFLPEFNFYQSTTTKNRQPRQTLILALDKSEENLLAGMHAKTRYNIHLAEKNGLEIKSEKNSDIFWELNEKTILRDKFKSHEKKYYRKMLALSICHQLTAYYQGRALASNILLIQGKTAVYLHGASSNEFRNLMAPYLLQWEGIKLAKKLNCDYYDFWGVSPRQEFGNGQNTCFHNFCWAVNDRWTGVTRFKAGFGGIYHEYPPAYDIIFRPVQYKIYQFLKKVL